jgi:hypothetical protein
MSSVGSARYILHMYFDVLTCMMDLDVIFLNMYLFSPPLELPFFLTHLSVEVTGALPSVSS